MSDEPSQGESSEVQFVEQSGDEENLWEVLEITAERSNSYRVKWAGTDPSTGKPWQQSWVPKHDCTPELVSSWRQKKRSKRQGKSSAGSTTRRSGSATRKSSSAPSDASTVVSSKKRKVVDEDDITHAPLDSNHQSAKPVKKRRRILPEAVPTEEEEEEDNDVITVPVRNPVKSNQPLREVHKTPPAKPQQNDRRSPPLRSATVQEAQSPLHDPSPARDPSLPPQLPSPNKRAPPTPPAVTQPASPVRPPVNDFRPHTPRLSPNAEARLARWEKDVNFHEPNTNDTVHLLNDDSYRNGVVPETQEPLLSPPPPDVSPVRLHTIMDIPSTPREKLIWRMRPKTPSLVSLLHGSPAKSSPSHPSRKPLRPVPVVTPSAFALNMPSTFDTIQTADIDEVDNDHADDSIDQFSSPLKGAQGRRSSKQRSAPTSNNKRTPSPRTPKQISGGSRANSQLGSGSRMFQFNASGLLGTSKSNDAEQIQGSDPRIQLREEEEENTQDLAAPLQDDDVQIPQPQASTISSPHPPPNDSPKVPRPPSPISPGLQNGTVIDDSTVSDLPQTESQESQDRTNSSQPSHTYPPTQGEHLGAALTLLNTKSEEISKIEAELSTERAKNAESNRQIDFLRGRLVGLEAMATETARERSRERHDAERMLQDAQRATRVAEDLEAVAKFNLDKVRAVEESKREELVVERDRWKSECDEVREERDRLVVEKASLLDALELSQKGQTEWETEKAAMEADIARLKAAVEAANESKRSTEKDCEFFRDQYAQASGFVTTVREENAELEKRVKIAESQTSTGVDAVRMLYERQVEAAQQDTARWKHLTDILTERDMRTGGEDIRRRANLEPELRKRVDELEATILRLQDDVDTCKAEAAVLKRDKDRWVHYNEVWKKTVSAQADEIAKRNKLVSSQLSIGDSIEPARLHSVEDSDELVYPCLWRFDTLQPPFSCTSLFADIEGLHHHVISVHAEDPSDPE
ncbi:hypothetical protein PC9H_001831 [Pleurotus ostreatus]|uniref:Chromo domain-containing protein n=1 Tax=Pleurotus ostreatus TaxID=5322 RepID=A0A8H6ZK66_PLEOS|nr:uncharacterized protein PC9H_001831 [Pleurotus ostreatus]KAF7419244.1 hypothetical protein PC9H_001831 [Pleurotus ostreatus]